MSSVPGLRLRLPATSANLGPGFDALGLALDLYLTLEARVGDEFAVDATGRNVAQVRSIERNLILKTYRECAPAAPPLHLTIHSEIPLGMGLGSSATALLAGVALANHFGGLGWSSQHVMEEACRREGHPDNVAACWLGGMTASAMTAGGVVTATCGGDLSWPILVAMPSSSLSTEKARAMLPPTYSRADTVANVQAVALLTLAFAQNRPELLRTAMQDRMHQPYRMEACPLLAKLLPLMQKDGIAGVSLSGAGPSVLLIGAAGTSAEELRAIVTAVVPEGEAELVSTTIAGGAAVDVLN